MKRLSKRVLVILDEETLAEVLEQATLKDKVAALITAVEVTRVFNDNTLASVADQADAEIALRDQLDHELGIEIGSLVEFKETDEPD